MPWSRPTRPATGWCGRRSCGRRLGGPSGLRRARASTARRPIRPPDRWTVPRVRDEIARAPDGQEWLTALVSALHAPARRRSARSWSSPHDPAAATCWLAAATLLLPQVQALRVGFKVFAADLTHSRHDVIAVHSDWADPRATVSSGFAAFDLVQGAHSTVTPTDAARFWVPRFLARDPFDVVDAVELAERFAPRKRRIAAATADPAGAAVRLAAAVTLLGEPAASVADARVLRRLARRRPAGCRRPGGEPGHRRRPRGRARDADALRQLVAAVARHGPRELVAQTLAGLLAGRDHGGARGGVAIDRPRAAPAAAPGGAQRG